MRRAPTWSRWVLVGGAILVVVLLIGRPGGDGPPLDPSSTEPLGTRALVLLLEDLGAEVDVREGGPAAGDDVVLLLADTLDDGGRRAVADHVEGGGRLVVADPGSLLQPFPVADPVTASELAPDCDVPALGDVERVDPVGGVGFDVPLEGTGCFPSGAGAFVALADVGRGTVAGIGGAGAFTNAELGTLDNAVLAGALLAPEPGTRVALLRPAAVGGGQESLRDLVAPGVWGALLQLGVAFLLYALWRARRLGRPVEEPQPVRLAASELVVAVGHLLQQAGRRDQAAALLRADLRRRLAEHMGLALDASAEVVATAAAARTGLPVDRLRTALSPRPVGDDEDLVALSVEITALEEAARV
jgi:hypothetical protein